MVDTFLGSLVQSRCGEEGMLLTNNTGMCSQCLSHTGPAPAHCTHRSGSRLLCQELSEPGPGLHAPPRSKPLRFRHCSCPQRHRLDWPAFCALPRSEQSGDEVFGEHGCCDLLPPPIPAAQFSGCTTSAPSQADVNCPEPQEVLISKEACLQFGR